MLRLEDQLQIHCFHALKSVQATIVMIKMRITAKVEEPEAKRFWIFGHVTTVTRFTLEAASCKAFSQITTKIYHSSHNDKSLCT